MDGDRKPDEAPTSRLVIEQEDLDRIAQAIRDGLGKEPPDGRKLLLDIVRVAGAFVLLVLIFLALNNWRPTVDVLVDADPLSTPQVLRHAPDEGVVDLQVGTGRVQALTVDTLRTTANPATDEFTIALPIATADCAEIAAELDATCDGDVVEVQAPVTVAWRDPQVLSLEHDPAADQGRDPVPHELRLDLRRSSAETPAMAGEAADESGEQSEAATALPELTIADQQAASQRWCFEYGASGATTLSITGGSAGYDRPFEPASALEHGCDALRLRVVPGAATTADDDSQSGSPADSDTEQPADEPRRSSSVVILSGISSFEARTVSRHLNASALKGSLNIFQDDRVLDDDSPTSFTGERIVSDLEIEAGTPSVTIDGDGMKSIETRNGNLVTTVWQRHSDLAIPIFIAVVGVFIPLLGTAYRNGVDFLAARRTRPGPTG